MIYILITFQIIKMWDFINVSNSKKENSKLRLMLLVHKHRVFRGFFVLLLLLHMFLLLVPWIEIKVPA